MKAVRWFIIVVFILALSGCTTAKLSKNKIKEIKYSHAEGLLLISIGSKHAGYDPYAETLPFIDYEVYSAKPGDKGNRKKFLTSEAQEISNFDGHLGKGKHGVIHLFSLPAGRYLLRGKLNGPTSMVIQTEGKPIYVPGTSVTPIDVQFLVRVKAGHLNYAGELLVISNDLNSTNSIQVSNQYQRDIEFATHTQQLRDLRQVVNFAKRIPPKNPYLNNKVTMQASP